MASKDAQEIFAAEDITREIVEVPEWGRTVELRELTGQQRDAIETLGFDGKLVAGHFVVFGCFNPETRARIFDSADLDTLQQKSGRVIAHLATRIRDMSGLNPFAEANEGKDESGTSDGDSSSGAPPEISA